MQALFFEVTPREGHEDHYFSHASRLRPILARNDGLIFIERFKSQSRPNVILSHSVWRDEASIARWRTDREHHKSQTAGRSRHFENYRIRVAHIVERYVRATEKREFGNVGFYNESPTTPVRYLVVTGSSIQSNRGRGEVFESVTEKDSFLNILETSSEEQGRAEVISAQDDRNVHSVLLSRVSRDYGMYDRAEAPQFFTPVEK